MTRFSILLIEDDVWLAQSYATILNDHYDVKIVENGAAAMECIDDEGFDLLVADVMLESGLVIDLLHELQSYPDTMNIPVIICSSLASTMTLEELAPYGVVKILDKATVTPQELKTAVQQALSVAS